MTEAEFNEWKRRGRPNKAAYLREIGLNGPPIGTLDRAIEDQQTERG